MLTVRPIEATQLYSNMMGVQLNPNQALEARIELQTRLGSSIENSQTLEWKPFETNQFKDWATRVERYSATERSRPSPIYNCHGMTFASRRTKIFDAADVRQIIDEDGYRRVFKSADVLPGDVLLYVSATGDIPHSATVIGYPETPLFFPLVISKWGFYSEVIHFAHQVPDVYRIDGLNLEYYRISDGYEFDSRLTDRGAPRLREHATIII